MEITKEILIDGFKNAFNEEPDKFFVAPGRLEIVGNHTDHNHGLAIVASASLYIKAAVRKRDDGIINLNSHGSKFYGVSTIKGEPRKEDRMNSKGLIRGVVNGFINYGYNVGGFDAYCISEVPSGGGVSSSAAFELLICAILNGLYNDNKVDKITMAKISHIAERDYFGKPCGILDQIGCACGGVSFVDFNDPENPVVRNTSFPLDLKIVLVNPGASHAGLTDYYASIPNDMYSVAHKMGKEYLREATFQDFILYKNTHPSELTHSEIARATHFYLECHRVLSAYKAITEKDEVKFLKHINDSGLSSSLILKNTCVPGKYSRSPERALRVARKYAPHSAHRVHGGGFMGTIISFLREEDVLLYTKMMEKSFGEGSVIEVKISPFGAGEF